MKPRWNGLKVIVMFFTPEFSDQSLTQSNISSCITIDYIDSLRHFETLRDVRGYITGILERCEVRCRARRRGNRDSPERLSSSSSQEPATLSLKGAGPFSRFGFSLQLIRIQNYRVA